MPSSHVQTGRFQVLFVQPSTGTVFLKDPSSNRVLKVKTGSAATVQTGDIVAVAGESGGRERSAAIENARLHTVGRAPFPIAPEANFQSLFSGGYDSRWLTIEGIIKSVRPILDPEGADNPRTPATPELKMIVSSGWDQLEVSTPASGEAYLRNLIDARVRLRAVVSNQLNDRNLLVGVLLLLPGTSCLEIVEPSPGDPFALPITRIGATTTRGAHETGHRVHIRGVVTSSWDKQNFSVMDSNDGIWVATDRPVQFGLGDLVDVAGFPSMGDYTAILDNALVRRVGSAAMPAPVRVTAVQALSGTHDAEPVEIDGWLVSRSMDEAGIYTMLLTENHRNFVVTIPPAVPHQFADRFRVGSLLRVRGVCVINAGGDHIPKDFNVLLRSPADVIVLESPSFWTPLRMLMLAGVLLAVVLVVIVWNVMLRRQVRTQTSIIRSQLETASELRRQAEAAHDEKSQALSSLQSAQRELLAAQEELRYQATHDSLTGLWNRAAIMEALRNEIERAGRTTSPLGILLLDLDHFKLVNDTYGHLVGDTTLKEIARRLAGAMRPYDVAGRFGGEEFLLLLPACGRREAGNIAERIRFAIAAAPFSATETEFVLTVSIGATICPDGSSHDSDFLNQADQALYQAKSSGRNCIILHGQPGFDPEHPTRAVLNAR